MQVLVLYDAPAPGVDGNKLGKAYAIMLRNLIGHWDAQVTMAPVQSYAEGGVDAHDATFYIGWYYGHPLPGGFLNDVRHTRKTVVWIKSNLWQLDAAVDLQARYGFRFTGLRGADAAPTVERPRPGFFDTVDYKGLALRKHYAYDPARNAGAGDVEIGATAITDPARAALVVPIRHGLTGEQVPYVLRSGAFWYVADLPLSYIGPRDRYLVLCDLLHDMLGTRMPTVQRALVRLEDVSHTVSFDAITRLTDYLHARHIPFGIATIARFRDQHGVHSRGEPRDVPYVQAHTLRQSLQYMVARQGRVVAHGWTHQRDGDASIGGGVSGSGFEFWDAAANRPVPQDSLPWALQRVDNAIAELRTDRLNPIAFEMPHYQGSPLAYKAVRKRFPVSWGRLTYFTSDDPKLSPDDPDRDFAVGQFFPFVIQQDHYGNRVLPENIGFIGPHASTQLASYPSGQFGAGHFVAEDLIENARHAAVVRDGFAAFFFHPLLLERSPGDPGMDAFRKVIEGLTALGFTWVDPAKL